MQRILIVNGSAPQQAELEQILCQCPIQLQILRAPDREKANQILEKHSIDLLLYDTTLLGKNHHKNLLSLTSTFPYIPCIALFDQNKETPDKLLDNGVQHCFTKPFDEQEFLVSLQKLLEQASAGSIKGIPTHSFLQMLESEQKTCTVEVSKNKERGFLFLKNGVLINAETKHFSGEKAARLILNWNEANLQLRCFNGLRQRKIKTPLLSIVMDAFRVVQENQKPQNGTPEKHQLKLRHLSTRGKQIPLDLGTRLRIEFPNIEKIADTSMIGMLKERCLILTNPLPYSDLENLVGSRQRVIVKYVHSGKAWMFKAQLLRYIESPYQLLFLDYPGVIHYHELRKSKRSAIYIPSTFHLPGEKELYGALIDLSTNGGLYHVKQKPGLTLPDMEINATVVLRCLLPGIKEEQEIQGKIRNRKLGSQEAKIGIEFINLQPHLADTIGSYLYSIESTGNH